MTTTPQTGAAEGLVERVAMAINKTTEAPGFTWDVLFEKERDVQRAKARAAIKASGILALTQSLDTSEKRNRLLAAKCVRYETTLADERKRVGELEALLNAARQVLPAGKSRVRDLIDASLSQRPTDEMDGQLKGGCNGQG